MMARLPSDAQRAFFAQPFLAASLYDVFPLAIAGIACGAITGEGYLEFVRVRTVMQAESDVSGVYKLLLKVVSAEALASKVPRLVGQYSDFARLEVTTQGAGIVAGRHVGIPRALAPWWRVVTDTYVRTLLARGGTKDIDVTYAPLEPSGTSHGIATVEIPFITTWST
jgi:hypothetical protein